MSESEESDPTSSPEQPHAHYWTPERLDLYRWLSLRAPEVASTYAGALHIMESDFSIPGREHFVAHAAREIWNRVVELVLGPDGSPRASDRFEWIVSNWRVPEEYKSCEDAILIPFQIYREVDNNVREYNSRQTPRQKNKQMLRKMIGPMVPDDELNFQAKRLSDTTRRFVRAAHLTTDARTVDWYELVDAFTYIEGVVHATTRPSTSIRRELDEILDEANA